MFKTRRFVTFVGMMFLVGTMPTSVFAVSKHTTAGAGHFRSMDKDKSGAVSKSEFLRRAAQTFHQRDVNKSGQLEANELSAALLRQMDRDNNGRVSKSEYMQHALRTFNRLDVNKSGQLEPHEWPSSHSCEGTTC